MILTTQIQILQREDITRSVKIKVAKIPAIGASSDKDE